MEKKIEKIVEESILKIQQAQTMDLLEDTYKEIVGKTGELSQILKGLKDATLEEKQVVGPLANSARVKIEEEFGKRKHELRVLSVRAKIEQEHIDISLPGRKQHQFSELSGAHNPFDVCMKKCVEVFERCGFEVWDGSHIVSDFDCFGSLNFKEDHPARDMQDTFYVEDGYILRTHTSALQNAILSQKNFPIRAIAPGKCFRNEATDATHEVIFEQLEGVVVDEHSTVSHLIGTLKFFLQQIFEKDISTRIRPGYFPFVEPGLELEIDRNQLFGIDADKPKWLEVMPCGMIHPEVLRKAGIDPQKYSGFAFGFGITRLAMLTYGMNDVRLMFSGDPAYLTQFRQ